MCAIRELREETKIEKADYYLIPGAIRNDVYIDRGTQYYSKYFIACAHPNLSKKPIHARSVGYGDYREVGDIAWMSIDEIKFIDEKKHLQSIIKPAINIVKQYNRGKWRHKF
jgi:8-oxo-dGTP pyrophosphatase MutT (NUDIX family)